MALDKFKHGISIMMKSCMIYATIGAVVATIGTLVLPVTVYTGLLLIIVGTYLFLVGGPICYFKG